MDDISFEKQLSSNGFTKKDLKCLRRHMEKEGVSHLVLLFELKRRFIASLAIVTILLLGWIYTIAFEDRISNITYPIVLAIVLLLIYIFTPFHLGLKCFLLKRPQ